MMKKIEKVAIVGAGALGVMYGQRLTKVLGKDQVFFVADTKRVDRYHRQGFFCNGENCDFQYMDGESTGEKADLIIFSVKFTGIHQAVQHVKNLVGKDTVILSMINGITSEEVIGHVYGEDHMLYCVAQGMDTVKEENRISYQNMGLLVLGDRNNQMTEPLKRVAEVLEEAGIPYQIPADIMHCLWSKWMLNTGVNQVTAVFATSYGGIQVEGEARQMMIAAMREVQRVAAYEGVSLTDEDIQGWTTLMDSLNPDSMTSMRQDTKAHRPTEVELFAGTVRRLGEKHGVATPVNDFLYQKIKELES